MKVLYVGDLHICDHKSAEQDLKNSKHILERAKEADLVIFCGDFTDAGRPEQYALFKKLYAHTGKKVF